MSATLDPQFGHMKVQVGPYTLRRYTDGWWVTLTATAEQLRGPLPSLADAEDAAERYERLNAAVGEKGAA